MNKEVKSLDYASPRLRRRWRFKLLPTAYLLGLASIIPLFLELFVYPSIYQSHSGTVWRVLGILGWMDFTLGPFLAGLCLGLGSAAWKSAQRITPKFLLIVSWLIAEIAILYGMVKSLQTWGLMAMLFLVFGVVVAIVCRLSITECNNDREESEDCSK